MDVINEKSEYDPAAKTENGDFDAFGAASQILEEEARARRNNHLSTSRQILLDHYKPSTQASIANAIEFLETSD